MTINPTKTELSQFNIKAIKGVDVGIGQADPLFGVSAKLIQQYPDRLVLVQSGNWLHGYNRTAFALHTLKGYKLSLAGKATDPHLRIGFPVGNFKQKLWPLVDQLDIPYVVAIGSQATSYELYVSNNPKSNSSSLDTVSDDIVSEVIQDLISNKQLKKVTAHKLLSNPETSGFLFKDAVIKLDTQILFDLVNLPRDIRSTWGENLRQASQRLLRNTFLFGKEDNKPRLLKQISADIDMLKHCMLQVKQVSRIKINYENRVGLVVELGRLAGGLIKAAGEKS